MYVYLIYIQLQLYQQYDFPKIIVTGSVYIMCNILTSKKQERPAILFLQTNSSFFLKIVMYCSVRNLFWSHYLTLSVRLANCTPM